MVHAAYTSDDLPSDLVRGILSDLEDSAVRLVAGERVHQISQDGPVVRPSSRQVDGDVPLEHEDATADVDPAVVGDICVIASEFLRVERAWLKPETSLLSVGLDSVRSVGLSRKLTSKGYKVSSADIMRVSTPIRLAGFVARRRASNGEDDDGRLTEQVFAAECAKLDAALDHEAVKLSQEDAVRVYPTSALQAGMLSQVK